MIYLPLAGKVALVTGIANDQSVAYGIAKELKAAGAEIAMTIQNEKTRKFTAAIAEELQADCYVMDLTDPKSVEEVMDIMEVDWGGLDIVVHSVAFAPQQALHGHVTDVTAEDFATTMNISVHTFIRLVNAVEPLLSEYASVLTVSYLGAERAVDGYGIMGVAKAALESAARYMAYELGTEGVRVNVLSPGPIQTRAASGITGFDGLLTEATERSMTKKRVTIEDVGKAAVALCANPGITGQTLYIDGGFNVVGL